MFTSNETDEESSNYEEDFNEENSNNEEDNKAFPKKNILSISKKFKYIKNMFTFNEEDEENSNYEEDFNEEKSNNEEDINEENVNIDDYADNEGFEKDVINSLYFLTIKYFGMFQNLFVFFI